MRRVVQITVAWWLAEQFDLEPLELAAGIEYARHLQDWVKAREW